MLNETSVIKISFPYCITHKNNISNIILKTGRNAFIAGERWWTCFEEFASTNRWSSCWFKSLSYWWILLILNWFHYLWWDLIIQIFVKFCKIARNSLNVMNCQGTRDWNWILPIDNCYFGLVYATLVANFSFAYSAKCLASLSITLDSLTSL